MRARLFNLLFDYMRRGLAIATEALDRQRILQVAEASQIIFAIHGSSTRTKSTNYVRPGS